MNELKVDDAGFGAAARVALHVYEQASRGSGRSQRMVMALEPNSRVIVQGDPVWMRNMIRDLRGPDFKATVVSSGTWYNTHREIAEAKQRRQPIAIDHHLIKALYMERIASMTRDLVEIGIEQHNYSIVHDEPPPAAMFDMRKWPLR